MECRRDSVGAVGVNQKQCGGVWGTALKVLVSVVYSMVSVVKGVLY